MKFFRSAILKPLLGVCLSLALAPAAWGQPGYREKQERLIGQSQKEETPKQNRINIFDGNSVRTYRGKSNPPAEREAVFEAIRGTFRGETQSGGGGALGIAGIVLLIAVLGGVAGYVYYYVHVLPREAKDGYDNPRELFRELCRAHNIEKADQKFLRTFAIKMEVDDVLLLFIDPRFFDLALRDRHFAADAATIRRLRTRLFGYSPGAAEKSRDSGRERLPIEISAKERNRYARELESGQHSGSHSNAVSASAVTSVVAREHENETQIGDPSSVVSASAVTSAVVRKTPPRSSSTEREETSDSTIHYRSPGSVDGSEKPYDAALLERLMK